MFYVWTMLFFVVFLGLEDVVYVDESGINKALFREYARVKAGKRVHGTRPGKRQIRTNIVAGLWGKKHVAVECYEHSTTAAFFENWFEFELIPAIPEWSLIILDNASFHRKRQLFEIAERYHVFVLFLPPYSPDLTPIEHSLANFKRWLRDNILRFPNLQLAADLYFDG
jgi:transposase